MTDMPPPTDRRALGRAVLAARAARVRRVRRRVAASGLAAFALAWGVIASTGPTGTGTAATASTLPAGTATPSSSTDTTAAPGSTGASAAGRTSDALTTSQS
jgi:hypothetical protein